MKKNFRIMLVLLTVVGLVIAWTANAALEADSEITEVTEDNVVAPIAADVGYADALFSKDVITINITTTEDDWAYLVENASSEPYISADIEIDGVVFEQVGLRTKGNSSLKQVASSDSERFSLKLNFDKYQDDQSCYGLDKLVLNDVFKDTTYLKEYLSYELFDYMEVPSSLYTFAEITLNGEYFGFYVTLEDVDGDMLDRVFGEDNDGEAYKPENTVAGGVAGVVAGGAAGGEAMVQVPQQNVAVGNNVRGQVPANAPNATDKTGEVVSPLDRNRDNIGGAMQGKTMSSVSLVYTDDELSSYSDIFDNAVTNTDEEDHARLIESLKAISEGENLEQVIDVDEVLRYTAVNVFLVNMDSYFATMGHNYCLYEEDGQLSMIPWDYNESFGTHGMTDSSQVINYAIDTVFNGVSAEERPIIGVLLENEEYMEQYHEYLAQIVDYVTSDEYTLKLEGLTDLMDPYIQNDTTSFNGYTAFLAGVENLKTFITLRSESVMGQLDGSIPALEEDQIACDCLIDATDLNLTALSSSATKSTTRR